MTEDKAQWAKERQPEIPNFGDAQLVSEKTLLKEVQKRRRRCQKVLRKSSYLKDITPNLVSVVILSCRRPEALKRLCDSLIPYFESVETYDNVEFILVDNDSGPALLKEALSWDFFDQVIAFEKNLGMTGALQRVFSAARGEYILFLEDDFLIDYDQPFLSPCLSIFDEYPEIGLLRLKNQNNWGKSYRRISPLRFTASGTAFWTWLPSVSKIPGRVGSLNGWTAGSVLFRKVSYLSVGELPEGKNIARSWRGHQGDLYENVYGRRYNKHWLSAKVQGIYPFVQPNDEAPCSGWGEEG